MVFRGLVYQTSMRMDLLNGQAFQWISSHLLRCVTLVVSVSLRMPLFLSGEVLIIVNIREKNIRSLPNFEILMPELKVSEESDRHLLGSLDTSFLHLAVNILSINLYFHDASCIVSSITLRLVKLQLPVIVGLVMYYVLWRGFVSSHPGGPINSRSFFGGLHNLIYLLY